MVRLYALSSNSNPEYESVERVFALLILLIRNDGLTREEIYKQVAGYDIDDPKRATSRMFERDIACLERIGFHIWSQRRGREPALYRIVSPELVLGIEK
jgi:hypothetical protein